jgi:hypothetical protein
MALETTIKILLIPWNHIYPWNIWSILFYTSKFMDKFPFHSSIHGCGYQLEFIPSIELSLMWSLTFQNLVNFFC